MKEAGVDQVSIKNLKVRSETEFIGDCMIWIQDRKKLNEYIISGDIISSHNPFFRNDFSYHLGQIFIQYDEKGQIESDDVKIISEVTYYNPEDVEGFNEKFKYIFIYVMKIEDWINSQLEIIIDDILKYGLTEKLNSELQDLRKLSKDIENSYTSIFETSIDRRSFIESLINEYFINV